MKKTMILATMSLLWVGNAQAADSNFATGKKLFQEQCLACHNAQLDPPQAPPMFGVQMKYKMVTDNKQDFVERVTSFATHPSIDKALMKKPVQVLGLMPDMGFEEDDVKLIAAYIHDETFAPPCKHWQVAMRIFQERGDMKAYRHHKQRYDAMCSAAPATAAAPLKKTAAVPATTSAAKPGTLKAIMQQLGRDYAALDQAILMEDFDAAAAAANHIAKHDKPSLGQKMKIMAGLRTEMSAFKQADGKVHTLAVEIEKAAKAKDMPLLIQRQSGMLSACMACHTGYRSKVKNILD